MGLAIVNEQTCLPFAGREACQLCVDECIAAGYDAIEFRRVGTLADEMGLPVEGTGYLAPVVLPEKCVGCGLCQTRCYGINVAEKDLLTASAIIIEAGNGKEDRMMTGSYVSLRKAERQSRETERLKRLEESGSSGYLPDFLENSAPPAGQPRNE
jgi:NAD-dependent dihydropyrimidine dehydrogenase PreA subunit